MENRNNGFSATNAEPEKSWQQAENEENQIRETNKDSDLDLRSAEAGGFGIGEDQEENSIYASAYSDDPDEDDDDDEDEEDDSVDRDWGTVDPQEHPGIPSDMDPSGPGSAV